MKKIFTILIIGIFVVNGLCTVVVVGDITKQNIQVLSPNSRTINNDKFEIEAKYSYIRSYLGGGGIFIIKMTPKNDFSGFVTLQINANPNLNAQLDKDTLNKQLQIAEIAIQPNDLTEFKTYEIELTATYHKKSSHVTFLNWISKIRFPLLSYIISRLFNWFNGDSQGTDLSNIYETLTLEVEMFNWSSDNLTDAVVERDELIDWLEVEHPEFGVFSGMNSFAYITYPAHLIVEHWTFLYDNWEMRICYHVMIPPYNWSMLWLRPLGEVDAVFSAKREYNGTAYEIPISDYPTFYGY
jgi:hypothetical protein